MKRLTVAAALLLASPAFSATVDLCSVTNAASAELTDEVLVCRPGTPNLSRLVSVAELLALETDPGVPLLALSDLGDLCAGGESTRRNAGDTANECYAPPSGDVIGPASATDNAVARFDSTTGKLIQDSGVTVSDTGVVATPSGGAVDFSSGTVSTGAIRLPFGVYIMSERSSGADLKVVRTASPAGNDGWMWFGEDVTIGIAVGNSATAPLSVSGPLRVGTSTNPTATPTMFEVAAGATTNYNAILKLTPQVNAPATCTAATDIYSDTSGALCFCSSTNVWENLTATGACT